jgi:hypothetical protein
VQKDDVISEVDDALVIGEPLSVVQELLSGPLRAEVELALLRLDKKTSSKQRFSAVVLFDHKPRPVDKAEYGLQNDSSRGEPGIVYSDDAMGLKVKGFVTGSSAASSGLQIGDVIVEVEDELLMGLSSALAFEKMTGDRNTEVAVTAMRKNPKTGGKERVSAYVLRDIGTSCKVGRPGFDSVLEPSGLRVTGIVPGCSIVDADLMLGDIITSINEDLIPGMTFEDVWPLLWGEMNSSVELMITRLVGGVKRRLTIDAVRDYDPSPEVPHPPPLGSSTAFVATQKIQKIAPRKVQRSAAPRPDQSSASVVRADSSKGSTANAGVVFVALIVINIAFLVYCSRSPKTVESLSASASELLKRMPPMPMPLSEAELQAIMQSASQKNCLCLYLVSVAVCLCLAYVCMSVSPSLFLAVFWPLCLSCLPD